MSHDQPTRPRPEDTGTVFDEPGGGLVLAHPLPLWLLATVFLTLIGLTILTVSVTHFELGSANIWVALLIAGIKGTLVAEIFMHLHWDRPFHRVMLISAIAFVVLFIGIALMDSHAYQPNLIQGYAPSISQ